MLRVLSAEQSRAIEKRAVRERGISLYDLMRRAGTAVADEIDHRYPDRAVCVLAGAGNNGGDGWVAAQRLHERGREVFVIAMRPPEELQAEASLAAGDALKAGVSWRLGSSGPTGQDDFRSAKVVVDALLGTGSILPLRGSVAEWSAAVNASGLPVLAVDLPTGCASDSGAADAQCVSADVTVTFQTPKLGLVTYPAAANAGDVVVADIGIPAEFADIGGPPELWTDAEYASLVPLPAADAHKNSRGRVLVVAGSSRFPGAAVLAAWGAMRTGAGYVSVAVPEPAVTTVQSHLVAAPVIGLPASRARSFASSAASRVRELAVDYDAVVLGPGLTLADGAVALAREAYATLDRPLVVDADALNALVDAADLLGSRTAPTVLTPHPGEMARILGTSVGGVQADRVSSSARLAAKRRVVVLKGAGTVVSNAERTVIMTAGSPALATAGTGDVLSGMIGALLAQGLHPLQAGALGAHLHGRAGEAAAEALTPVSVTAEDLPEFVPVAMRMLLDERYM